MARHEVDERSPVVEDGHDVGLIDRVTTKDASGVNVLARVLGLVAAAVPTIVGLLAIADIDWSGDGFDAPAVTVAGMRLTPVVAVALVAAGVVGLLVAGVRDRGSKLVVGALYACAGVVIISANPTVQDVPLSDRLGWMTLLVGAVLIVSGVLAVQRTTVTREVRTSTTAGPSGV